MSISFNFHLSMLKGIGPGSKQNQLGRRNTHMRSTILNHFGQQFQMSKSESCRNKLVTSSSFAAFCFSDTSSVVNVLEFSTEPRRLTNPHCLRWFCFVDFCRRSWPCWTVTGMNGLWLFLSDQIDLQLPADLSCFSFGQDIQDGWDAYDVSSSK